MPNTIDITVPDIGDFKDVEIIEVLVSAGDTVDVEQPLIALESDKATMDVPSTQQGKVKTVHVSVGDRVSEGSLVATLETSPTTAAEVAPQGEKNATQPQPPGVAGSG